MRLRTPHVAKAIVLACSVAAVVLADSGVSQSLAVPRHPCASSEHARLFQPTFSQTISGFGFRENPVTGNLEWRGGIDYLVKPGDLLQAAGLGRISKVGVEGPGDLFIAVNHGRGISVLYAHLGRTDHVVSSCVRAGDILGEAGSQNPVRGGQIIYIEVRKNGVLIDPSRVLLPYFPASEPSK